MELTLKAFSEMVESASTGSLQLPQFQRKFVWKRSDVLKLFNSIRQNYPIGGFLLLQASDDINLSPRAFKGVAEAIPDKFDSYVLDGQQRITAGLALFHGLGTAHYFLNLEKLWELSEKATLDFDDWHSLQKFASELDYEDDYLVGRQASARSDSLLESKHFLWTKALANTFEFNKAKDRYLEIYPDRRHFMERLVWPFFEVGNAPAVPVTVLDSRMPIEAITTVFETLNTSGQQLTPFEIVVAVLYAKGIDLRDDVEEFQQANQYYKNIDFTGALFLQTIALKSGENPKRRLLPKTIRQDNYNQYKDEAIDDLEIAGRFLSDRLGMGLDVTNELVSHDSMLAPLGIALAEIEHRFPKPSPKKAAWRNDLERWYIGSVLARRYAFAQPTNQENDTKELKNWINGTIAKPDWLSNIRIGPLSRFTPTSATGRLIGCLISSQKPKDPLNDEPVGGEGYAISMAQYHHIFPKAFCEQHIKDWDSQSTRYNLALNVMPLTKVTNRKWNKMDPANQVNDVRNHKESESKLLDAYAPFFINEECLKIMQKAEKTVQDFEDFIRAREKAVQSYITQKWGFPSDSLLLLPQEIEEDDEDI